MLTERKIQFLAVVYVIGRTFPAESFLLSVYIQFESVFGAYLNPISARTSTDCNDRAMYAVLVLLKRESNLISFLSSFLK